MDVRLYSRCYHCKGACHWYRPNEQEGSIPCSTCAGKGSILTKEGEHLLAFFKLFILPLLTQPQ